MKRILRTLLLLGGALVALSIYRMQAPPHAALERPVAHPPSPAQMPAPAPHLRVISLNMAHGRAQSFHQAFLRRQAIVTNLGAIAALLAREAPDVVALQEADGPSIWSGHFDHLEALAEAASYPHQFRGSHLGLPWPLALDVGTGLMSRLPLGEPASHAFAHTHVTTKGWVVATLTVPGYGGRSVDVVSTHLDPVSASRRAHQVDSMIAALGPRGRPLILMGDLNCRWREPDCAPKLAQALGLRAHAPEASSYTFPSGDPDRRLDWILISDSLRFVSYRVLPEVVSDHRAVRAEIVLAEGGA